MQDDREGSAPGRPPRRRRRRRGAAPGRGGPPGLAVGTAPPEGHRPGGGANAVVSAATDPAAAPAPIEVGGILQVVPSGQGFLRSLKNDYNADPADPIVPREILQRFQLETGAEIQGVGLRRGRAATLSEVGAINGAGPAEWAARVPFKTLVAEDPTERIRLELDPDELSTRVVDLIAPIGKGQRCLIVAPPKAGKTVLLQKIARSITVNHPEIHLIVLLVDERPEEVTDMRRTVRGEVVASSSDELARNHVQVAEIVLERAKRLVECGRDVVLLLDSITRLSRAYNTEQRGSGRVLSGGIDARTMEKPRRFFGAARKATGRGSFTVIGTALVDTGSRMDEVIFQEFKGTGNTEIVMDRGLFDRRIFPAIDISQTGTRKEEKLYTPQEYPRVTLLRRAIAPLKAAEAMQLLTERVARYRTNAEFLASLIP